MMNIQKHEKTIVIIGVYIPRNDAEEKVKEVFNDKLNEVLIQVSSSKEICLLGNFNTREGKKLKDNIQKKAR